MPTWAIIPDGGVDVPATSTPAGTVSGTGGSTQGGDGTGAGATPASSIGKPTSGKRHVVGAVPRRGGLIYGREDERLQHATRTPVAAAKHIPSAGIPWQTSGHRGELADAPQRARTRALAPTEDRAIEARERIAYEYFRRVLHLNLGEESRRTVADPVHAALAHLAPGTDPAALVRQGAAVPPKVRHERQPHPWSLSHPRGPHYTDAQLRAYGATPAEIWIIRHESGGYAWAWNPTVTATGHAYGLGQITGLFRLQHFGKNWESADPRVQIKMMKLYIRIGSSHFHTPAGAKAFWEAHGWY